MAAKSMGASMLPVLWMDAEDNELKDVLEVPKSELLAPGSQGLIVRDLIDILNKNICGVGSRQARSILLYGTRVSENRLLESLIPELDGGEPRLVVTVMQGLTEVGGRRSNMTVFVETPTCRTITIPCDLNDTVGYIKDKIEDKESIPVDEQRLIYGSKQLEDNHKLSLYGIQDQSTLHLMMRLCGGVAPRRVFVDMTDDLLLVEEKFSPKAPKWRLCRPGLNVEGQCMNCACVAFNEMIIHTKMFRDFNLLRDGHIMCPMCHSRVKPMTCGFYECVWKFEGVQASDGFSVCSPWREAAGDTTYHRFCVDEKCDSIEWSSLLVTAKPKNKLPLSKKLGTPGFTVTEDDICSFCWTEFGLLPRGAIATVHCGHSFHCACLAKWSNHCTNHDIQLICPLCREVVSR